MIIDKRKIRTWSMIGSTGTFGLAMGELTAEHCDLCVVTADLCQFSGLERFSQEYPDNLYNVGIAEQNMIGVAAGLASEGTNVFAATYASFATTRALDQVRISMGYMQLPIKLVGLTAGFSAGILGATHMAIEDIAIMRAIPGITILSPADCMEMVKCFEATLYYPHPVYIRLTGGKRMPIVYQEDYEFVIGKAILLKEGKDVCILATGTVVSMALQAAKTLEEKNISVAVFDVHTIKPIDKMVLEQLKNYKFVITVEEHSIIGGLGGTVAEELSKYSIHPKHIRMGVEDYYPHANSYNRLVSEVGMTAEKIVQKVVENVENKIEN